MGTNETGYKDMINWQAGKEPRIIGSQRTMRRVLTWERGIRQPNRGFGPQTETWNSKPTQTIKTRRPQNSEVPQNKQNTEEEKKTPARAGPARTHQICLGKLHGAMQEGTSF
jgi:hypothetical protein